MCWKYSCMKSYSRLDSPTVTCLVKTIEINGTRHFQVQISVKKEKISTWSCQKQQLVSYSPDDLLFIASTTPYLANENKLWHDYADIMNAHEQSARAILGKNMKTRLDPFASFLDKSTKCKESAASLVVVVVVGFKKIFNGPCKRGHNEHWMKVLKQHVSTGFVYKRNHKQWKAHI